MGRYIDWSHVTGRYKDATKLALANEIGSYWLAHAEALVDARLAVRYTVPFTAMTASTSPPLLVQDLAIDVCYLKLLIAKKKKKELSDDIEKRFEGLINGTILITDADGPIGPQSNIAWAENSYHSSFGMDDPTNWRVDSQSQQDIQDARGQFDGFFGR